jgi:hypothetical protein
MRQAYFFLGLAALAATGLVACSGDDANTSPKPLSDGGVDATAVDAGDDATSPDKTADGAPSQDAGDAESADATDAGDAESGDAADGGDAGLERAALRLAAGEQVIGVTSDNYVVYWVTLPVGTNNESGVLAVVSAGGGDPQILFTGQYDEDGVVVAGANVLWTELLPAGFDAGPCGTNDVSLYSWSAAHGVTQIASSIAAGSLQVSGASRPLGGAPGSTDSWSTDNWASIAVSPDGSEVAYVADCNAPVGPSGSLPDGGPGGELSVAVAPTDGTGSPRTAPLTQPSESSRLYLSGGTLLVQPFGASGTGLGADLIEVFAGDPLTPRTDPQPGYPNYPLTDPNANWLWVPASQGMELVRASDGSVLFTDPDADVLSLPVAGFGFAVFDRSGTNLFYLAGGLVKQLALASPTTAVTVSGAGVCTDLMAAAPNGAAVLCSAITGDGGFGCYVATTGAGSTTIALPTAACSAPDVFLTQFLADAALVWTDGASFFAELTRGGPVSTVTSLVGVQTNELQTIGGSQVAARVPYSSTEVIFDVTGNVPAFGLDPAPLFSDPLSAPPTGGLVAYVSGGAIYAVQTL